MKRILIFLSLLFPLVVLLAILLPIISCTVDVQAWGHENTVKEAKEAVLILGEVVGNEITKVYATEYEDGSYLLSLRLYSLNSLRGKPVHLKPGLKAARDILRNGGADTQTYIERRSGGYWYIEIAGCFLDDICNNGDK